MALLGCLATVACVSTKYDGGRVSEKSNTLFDGSGKSKTTTCSPDTLLGKEDEACARGEKMPTQGVPHF